MKQVLLPRDKFMLKKLLCTAVATDHEAADQKFVLSIYIKQEVRAKRKLLMQNNLTSYI